MVEVRSRPTEENTSWTRYAWQLTVANSESRGVSFSVEIQFLDRAGFVIDTDYEWSLYLPPMTTQTFTGDRLITAPVAPNVASVKAILTPK
jgi:hypothetical protein